MFQIACHQAIAIDPRSIWIRSSSLVIALRASISSVPWAFFSSVLNSSSIQRLSFQGTGLPSLSPI